MSDLLELVKLLQLQPSAEFSAATKGELARLATSQQQSIDAVASKVDTVTAKVNALADAQHALAQAQFINTILLVVLIVAAVGAVAWFAWRMQKRLMEPKA